jgi:hypothetical protein
MSYIKLLYKIDEKCQYLVLRREPSCVPISSVDLHPLLLQNNVEMKEKNDAFRLSIINERYD